MADELNEVESYFNAAADGEDYTPPEVDEAPAEAEQETEIVDTQPVEEPVIDPQPDPIETLKQQFAQQLEQSNQKLYGKIGELNRTIIELRSAQTSPPREITVEQLANFKAEFGEEAASLLAKDLSQLTLGGTQQINTSEAIESFKRDNAAYLLSVQHRDWRKVADSEAFSNFRQALPEQEQQLLQTSWDAGVIGDAMSSFKAQQKLKSMDGFDAWVSALTNKDVANKLVNSAIDPEFYTEAQIALADWNAKNAKAEADKQADKQLKKQQNAKRIEAAVTPRGDGSTKSNLTVEDYFNQYADG